MSGLKDLVAPMHKPEPGANIIEYNFLKELVQRVKDKSHDLAMRKHGDGYAIEFVVRNHVGSHDACMIGHCDNSILANKYVSILHFIIKES